MSTEPEPTAVSLRHGLYYVNRNWNDGVVFQIDREYMPPVPRPDRDILRALLRYALDRLDEQDAA